MVFRQKVIISHYMDIFNSLINTVCIFGDIIICRWKQQKVEEYGIHIDVSLIFRLNIATGCTKENIDF